MNTLFTNILRIRSAENVQDVRSHLNDVLEPYTSMRLSNHLSICGNMTEVMTNLFSVSAVEDSDIEFIKSAFMEAVKQEMLLCQAKTSLVS